MLPSRAVNLWAVCWLGLALTWLIPSTAEASRRRRAFAEEDPLCSRNRSNLCVKGRVAAVGGGIFTGEGVTLGGGGKAGLYAVVDPRLELGFGAMALWDDPRRQAPRVAVFEGLARIVTLARSNHRIFLELSLGGSQVEGPEYSYWAFPSGGVAVSLEAADRGIGFFLTAGLSALYSEGVAVVPHLGAGIAL